MLARLMLHARYLTMNVLLVLNCFALCLGGGWLWGVFFLTLLLSTVIDEAVGDDEAPFGDAWTGFLNAQLYLSLPLLALNIALYAYLWGNGDLLGFGALLGFFGIDLEAARQASGMGSLIGGGLALGLMIGAAGTNVAHELVHRTNQRLAMFFGRALLGFSFDTSFSIEHVYGHHIHVGTPADPATARRGEYVLHFALRSIIWGNVSAWRIETARLNRRKLAIWSPHNRFLRGQLFSIVTLILVACLGGPSGLLAVTLCGMQGKLYLELVNYIEHYGLVRVPGQRVEPRHSWNCARLISSAILFNLPRHSHHHMFAGKPYWQLTCEKDAPSLPFGYKTMIILTLFPNLWQKMMAPRLIEWDNKYANEAEKRILIERGWLKAAA